MAGFGRSMLARIENLQARNLEVTWLAPCFAAMRRGSRAVEDSGFRVVRRLDYFRERLREFTCIDPHGSAGSKRDVRYAAPVADRVLFLKFSL